MEKDAINIKHFCLKLLQCIYELQICGDNCDGVTQKQVMKQLKGRFVTDGDLDTQVTIGLRQICHKGFITRVRKKFKLVGPIARILLMPHNYKCRQKEIKRLQSVFFNSEEPLGCQNKLSCAPRRKRKKCKRIKKRPKKQYPCRCCKCRTSQDSIPNIFGSISPPHGSVPSIVIPRTPSTITTTGSFSSSKQSTSNGFIDYVSTKQRTMQLYERSQSNRMLNLNNSSRMLNLNRRKLSNRTLPLDQKSHSSRTLPSNQRSQSAWRLTDDSTFSNRTLTGDQTSKSSFERYCVCSQCGHYKVVCTCDSEAGEFRAKE